MLDEWLLCQRQWLYLEPIFSSDDINRQLPVESKRYQTMERLWRKIMKNAKENPQVKNIGNCTYLVNICFWFVRNNIYYVSNLLKYISGRFKRATDINHSVCTTEKHILYIFYKYPSECFRISCSDNTWCFWNVIISNNV